MRTARELLSDGTIGRTVSAEEIGPDPEPFRRPLIVHCCVQPLAQVQQAGSVRYGGQVGQQAVDAGVISVTDRLHDALDGFAGAGSIPGGLGGRTGPGAQSSSPARTRSAA